MVRNRQYDLTPREEELMDMMWEANRPMSRAELRAMPVERSWKDNYLPVMLQALEKRGLIQVTGFVREGKTYARQFVPTWSKAELLSKSAAEHLEKEQLSQMLEAMAESSAGELDTERLTNVMAALVRESKGKANAKLLDRLEDILQEVEEE
jgi:predicted transcriptional regulator